MKFFFGPLGIVLVALGQMCTGADAPADRPRAASDPIERLLAADDLLARGATRVYRGEFLAAINFPVGGDRGRLHSVQWPGPATLMADLQ